jgi:hypothetical protein
MSDDTDEALMKRVMRSLLDTSECQLLAASLQTRIEQSETDARQLDTLIRLKRDELANLDKL